jgi:hypothetical protein
MSSEILELEERLRLAMCSSDIAELDALLSEKLIFTNHVGQVISKSEDLESHRNRIFEISTILLSNTKLIELGNSVVVTTQAQISGSYNGAPASGEFCFTRVWSNIEGSWKVVSGHSSLIAEN